MRRATEPTHVFDIPLALDQNGKFAVIYRQGANKLIIPKSRIMFEAGTDNHPIARLNLSQRETNLFMENATVEIQIRCEYEGKMIASNVITAPVHKVLDDEIL